jgi:hypothetical protein
LVATQGSNIGFAHQTVVASARIDFAAKPVAGTTSINVNGDNGAAVSVWQFPAAYVPKSNPCGPADILSGQVLAIGSTAPTVNHVPINGAAPFAITLSNPLLAGTQLCLYAVETSAAGASTPYYSSFATVQDSKTPQPVLKFTSELVTGSSAFSIQTDTAGTVSIYLFGPGYTPMNPVPGQKDQPRSNCQDSDRAHGTPLTVSTSGQAAANSIFTVSAVNSPVAVTLSSPLVAGTQICLFESTTTGVTNTGFSSFKRVQYFAPGDDYGRFAVNLTGGVMISNEQQSSNSSTASQYFDLGLSYTLARPDSEERAHPSWFEEHGPGLSSLFDIRLTTIPVAASTNSTPAAGSTTLSQSLNVLSSQQSATVLLGFYIPFRLTHWYGKTNWITAAPEALGGFDTLLNPTTTTTAPAGTAAATTVTTTNFSSVYNFHAAGARFGWDIYSKRTDEAPIEFSWFSALVGWYSNLPSWLCTALPGTTPAANAKYFTATSSPTTSCFVSPLPSSTSSPPYDVYASRKLTPRVDIAGELKLPSYPVVFGYDANLGQYSKRFGGDHIDTLNKPGNDVRFYFGLKLNVTDALSKLGVQAK